jgi:hypothetical protein
MNLLIFLEVINEICSNERQCKCMDKKLTLFDVQYIELNDSLTWGEYISYVSRFLVRM